MGDGFKGLKIVSFESRLRDVMETSIQKQGGMAFVAPSMQEVPLTENEKVFEFGEKLFKGEIDVIVFMTGVGTKILLEVLKEKYLMEDILRNFQITLTIARGPKPVSVLAKEDFKPKVVVPEPNTWAEIIEVFRGVTLTGKTVAIQEYGMETKPLLDGLRLKGANVFQVPVYKWELPDDLRPLKTVVQHILKGDCDMALFTSATQMYHLIKFVQQEGKEEAFRKAFSEVPICSVGPVCSEAIKKNGFNVSFEPSRPKLGILVSEAAENAKEILDR